MAADALHIAVASPTFSTGAVWKEKSEPDQWQGAEGLHYIAGCGWACF
jgi:hypothetical protein